VNRQQKEPVPGRGEVDVNQDVKGYPKKSGDYMVAYLIHLAPNRQIIFGELLVWHIMVGHKRIVNVAGVHHHRPHILEEMG
jgi:hypothetical protein